MTIDELIRALYIGYEVEPEFNVGDWVVWDEMKIIGQLVEVGGELRVDSIDYDVPQSIRINKLRHATPLEIAEEKERRWWRKHNRDVWEIREKDLLISRNSAIAFEVRRIKGDIVHMANGAYQYFENIKREYKIACFAEDRKDVQQI